jgi:hypothetical protein
MKKLYKFLIIVGAIFLILFLLSFKKMPTSFTYGVSFSKFHSDELKLDWKKVYLALLDDLKVRNLRLSAHWPDTEPEDGKFDFSALDFQMREANKRNASVILAVGRRLPGWPECHEPDWVQNQKSKFKNQNEFLEFRNNKLLEYIETVVNRYKSFDNIGYWQVENEPFLAFFSRSSCGPLDEVFFKEEIDLVHKLDPKHPVLTTDSGEFGTWYKAYKYGDVFGTSMYLYVWIKALDWPLRYPITPAFFRIKQNLMELVQRFRGEPRKPMLVIELSTEPWLLHPITETPVKTQLERMGLNKFNEMISFSGKTGFDIFYLWGAEWWYWMRGRGHPEFWERAKTLFVIQPSVFNYPPYGG